MKIVPEDIIAPIIIIAIISVILFSIIMVIRGLFYIIIFIASLFYKPKRTTKKKVSPKTSTSVQPYKKEEDELLRDKKLENKKAQEENLILQNVQRMNEDFEKQMEAVDQDYDKIVGIVKPIGFWTSLVLGDQLSQILGRAQALNNRSHKGFWVSMLEAQARGIGRQESRQL
jgi:ABC-type transport system involved in cytochrome bd biosynthesis fused ATPase/permease subunit